MKDQILGTVRWFLTVGGTFLSSKGIVDGAEFEAVIGGIIAIASFIWSQVDKVKNKKKLEELAKSAE